MPELGLDEIKNLVLIRLTMVFNSEPVEKVSPFLLGMGTGALCKELFLEPNVWMVKMNYNSFARPLALLGFTMLLTDLFNVVPLL